MKTKKGVYGVTAKYGIVNILAWKPAHTIQQLHWVKHWLERRSDTTIQKWSKQPSVHILKPVYQWCHPWESKVFRSKYSWGLVCSPIMHWTTSIHTLQLKILKATKNSVKFIHHMKDLK